MAGTSFEKLTAADIMQTDVVTVDPGDSLQEAMSMMTENHVTGLAVLDRKSRCVGVVSATDVLNYEQEHSEFTSEANEDLARYYNPQEERWESVRVSSFALEEFAEVPVSEIMTRNLITVRPNTPVTEVAKKMDEARIHRILVVDEKQGLHGIISASDFVHLVAESG